MGKPGCRSPRVAIVNCADGSMLARRCSGRHGLAILTFWRCRMSFLIASPEALAATATYLTGIGSAISAANAVAAAPTTEILAAGTDEVSTAISALFGAHAQAYQALSAHVAAFHDQFVHTLTAGAGSYMAAEAAAASPLQALQLELLNAINAPTLALLGRPLIGDGTDA
ncbi:putative PE family protein, partial [Mycobacterium tuberculosis SUMu007]